MVCSLLILNWLALLIIGLAEGMIVGGSIAAAFSALGVVTRLAQLTKTPGYIYYYAFAITLGASLSSLFHFTGITFYPSDFFVILVGLFMGLFIGFLAGALTEVLNVLPIICRRLNLEDYLDRLLFCFILGKVIGSLFYWLYPFWHP